MVNSLVKSLKKRIKSKPTRQNKKWRPQIMLYKAWLRLFLLPSCISIVVFSLHFWVKYLMLEEDCLFGWIALFIHIIVSSKVWRDRWKKWYTGNSLQYFRYQWVYKGWNIEQRLSYMERHWAYFFGFGKYWAYLYGHALLNELVWWLV